LDDEAAAVTGRRNARVLSREGAMRDPRLHMLEQLVDERVRIAGDVLEVSVGVWAIHGSIPVDGEVILGEFALLDEARSVLDQLGPNHE
jgi:hypothetical protein